MARISKPTRICVILSVGVLLVLALVCLVAVLKFDSIFTWFIGKKVAILPGTEVYKNWLSPSVPIYFSIYLFNITNADAVLNGSDPIFNEVGPYVYREDRQRIDVQFSEENPPRTVRFKHRIFYHFVHEMSIGPDTEGLITSLDLPTAGLAGSEMPWDVYMVSGMFNYVPFTTQTPYHYIWGYNHSVTQLCYDIGSCATPKAGLMAANNGTKVVEYLIDTGAYDISNVGKVLEANNMTKLRYWRSDEANMINGTDGSVIRPNLKIGSRIDFFVPDLCRSFYSVAVDKTSAKNNKHIQLLRFASPPEQAMSAKQFPPNKAFCPLVQAGPECPLTGMIPVSPCSGGSMPVPIFASQPHFLGADPAVRTNLLGLKEPNVQNDSTVLLVEPNSGFVLEAYKRLQINMFVENTKQLDNVYRNMAGPYYFPISWFSEVAVADEHSLNRIHNLLIRPKSLIPPGLSAVGSFAAVLAIFVIAVLIVCSRLQRHTDRCQTILLAGVRKHTSPGRKDSDIPLGQWSTVQTSSDKEVTLTEQETLLINDGTRNGPGGDGGFVKKSIA